jgi:hypothetical protein
MRILLSTTLLIMLMGFTDPFVNTIWICKISKNCNDTLKFKSNFMVISYDCEMNYTFKDTYKILNDI